MDDSVRMGNCLINRDPKFQEMNMKKAKVLIADDNRELLAALQIQLEARGLEVTTSIDANMALAHAQQDLPDVMLIDVRMDAGGYNILSKGGDGLGLIERMSKFPELSKIPVIYITGDKSHYLELKARQIGAFGVIHKPIRFQILIEMIESAIGARCCSCGCTTQGVPAKVSSVFGTSL
jgi:CheY-like chemotaxis protein